MHGEGRRDHIATVHLQAGNKSICTWDFRRRSAKPDSQVKSLPDFDLKYNLSPDMATNHNSEGKGGDGTGGGWSRGVLEIIVVVHVEGQVLGIPLKRQLFLALTLVV